MRPPIRAIHVDGTNALHRLGRSPSEPADDLPAEQRALVSDVRRAASRQPRRPDTTLHFDGFPRGGGFGGTEIEGVHVRFSGDREADEAIVEAVRGVRDPEAVLVVTDDAELARRLRQLGATTSGVAAFLGARRPERAERRETGDDVQKPHVGGFTAADFGLPETIDTDDPDGV